MATDINELLDGKKGSSFGTVMGLLFKSVQDAHTTHLMQRKDKTLAKHSALGIYYETMPDILDTLIETYKPFYKLEEIITPESKNINDPLTYFNDLFNKVESVRGSVKHSFILSQLDIVQTEIAHCIFRLQFIES